MTPTRQGSFRLFRFVGVDVYLHWSWFLIGVIEIQYRYGKYGSVLWNVLEYLSLFLIVLLHEFGHALACRQVGGQANQIVLWPLGGVAYVSPPQRPGAMLWSIAAGPLVNVALAPFLTVFAVLLRDSSSHFALFVATICSVNYVLLIFNLLPVYPLDGGQILRSLLWFVFGRARSLMIASILGMVAVIGFGLAVAGSVVFGILPLERQAIWFGIMAFFILLNCWSGLTHARLLSRIAAAPRRDGFTCPECKLAPPLGDFWICGRCRKPFDMFGTRAFCPHCQAQYPAVICLECGSVRPISDWIPGTAAPPKFY